MSESEIYIFHGGIGVTVDKNAEGNGTVRTVWQDSADISSVIFRDELPGLDPHPNALRGAILGAVPRLRPDVSAGLMDKANQLIEAREVQAKNK